MKKSFVWLAPIIATLPALLLIFATSVLAIPMYSITDLGHLGGGNTDPISINNFGQITGSSDVSTGKPHAFLWTNGVMTDLGTLGGDSSQGFGINDSCEIVGIANYTQPAGAGRAFHWSNNTSTELFSGYYSRANDINNFGVIVGIAIDNTPQLGIASHPSAVIWENNNMRHLDGLGASGRSSVDAINNLGQIVGTANFPEANRIAFLWENGHTTKLGTLGGQYSSAKSINDLGQIVGYSDIGNLFNDEHAFLWENGTMVDLGTLGGSYSTASGINNLSHVVGVSHTGGEDHAFLWEKGVMTDLNDLIPGNSEWLLKAAYDINDQGQIIGRAILNGASHGYILTPTPIPEPATILLLGTGLIGLAGFRRKYKL